MNCGIYIVSLKNTIPISIQHGDKRYDDIDVFKANNKNIKIGKAEDFTKRAKNYHKTFGKDNVNFQPIITTNDFDSAEKIILNAVNQYREVNPYSGRKLEWLSGISIAVAKTILFNTLNNTGIMFKKYGHK